ncbi:unnamed protein product, partial [Prorocentrum cordatum]
MVKHEGITMESMEKLFKLHLRQIQADLEAIKAHGVSQNALDEAVNPLREAAKNITTRAAALEAKPSRKRNATIATGDFNAKFFDEEPGEDATFGDGVFESMGLENREITNR